MKIVHKIEDDMDRMNVMCTTYQMRNFYRQLGDGYFNTLDTMNYVQHHNALRLCAQNDTVLDVCCGRGLMLPLLRYYRKDIGGYTGVDIKPSNAIFTHKRVTDGKLVNVDDYYPFPVSYVHSNVAEMRHHIDQKFDVILYMSSIEHMHKDMGIKSLNACRQLISANGVMLITCPNTPEGTSGYDTQYAAHVYEWKRSELLQELINTGFEVTDEWCILASRKTVNSCISLSMIDTLRKSIPNEWVRTVLSPLVPVDSSDCKEIAMIVRPVGTYVPTVGEFDVDIDIEQLEKEYNERMLDNTMQ